MAISHKDYCSRICKAQCCRAFDGEKEIARCPKLNENNLCRIYKERFEEKRPYAFYFQKQKRPGLMVVVEMQCGEIENELKKKTFPAFIKAKCCYEHPELLEEHD